MITDEHLDACARVGYEANRAYSLTRGDTSVMPWDHAPHHVRESCLDGARGVLRGNDAAANHANWMERRLSEGWTLGSPKHGPTRQHPLLVPYEQLPADERVRNTLFVETVRTMLVALGYTIGAEGEAAPSAEEGSGGTGSDDAVDPQA